MKCPICITQDLLMTDRLGIEIDYCPQCRGVWLDRGELDKIIARSTQESVHVTTMPVAQNYGSGYSDRARDRHHDDSHRQHEKKSIWRELFD
jgi:Zn-finger nucleic acid-binding protein